MRRIAPPLLLLGTLLATGTASGDPRIRVLKLSVSNPGPEARPAEGVVVQATAWWCGNAYEQKNGGQQMAAVNGSIAPGAKYDLTLPVKVHSQNDTSIAVETLLGGKVVAIEVQYHRLPVLHLIDLLICHRIQGEEFKRIHRACDHTIIAAGTAFHVNV